MRVAVYARVSTEDQAERGTVQNQVEFATKYCDLHQLQIAEWYMDDGVTGTIPLEARPAGARLVEDAKAGRFDLLLIYRLDRLGRSARVILNSVYELEQYGVKIRSMTEPFDTGDPSGRFLLTILAGVADLERETIIERLRYGANRAARAGKWIGGIVPYGYRVAEGFLEVNEDLLSGCDLGEADVVRLIYRLTVEQDYTTFEISDYLNALGIPPSYVKDGRQVLRGKRKVATAGIWRPSRIRNMIVNTTYKGVHYYGRRAVRERELIEREVPPIVSAEVWEQAQHVLHDHQLEAVKNTKRRYLLRGLIKCGACGLTYHGTAYSGPGDALKAYYVCGGKGMYRGPLQGKCTSRNVPAQWIEDLVWRACVEFIHNPGEAITELAASMEDRHSQADALEAEREMLRRAAADKEGEKAAILDLYRKRLITGADVESQLEKIAQEKAALAQRLRDLDTAIAGETALTQGVGSIEALLASLRAKLEVDPPFEVRREIVKALVRRVVVDTTPPNGTHRPRATVTVHYAFSQDVTRTLKRAESNLDFCVMRREQLPPWFFGHEVTGDTSGARLRRARLAANMTIHELAATSGLSRATITAAEADRHQPGIISLRRLAAVLGCSVAHLGRYEDLPEDTLSQRITKTRLYHGETIEEFAKTLKINERTLRDWELGVRPPNKKHLNGLAPFLEALCNH